MIVSWKKPDPLFTEVRQRKLKELSEYSQKPPDEKARDIMALLTAMKAPKKGEVPVANMKEEDAIKQMLSQQ